MNTSVENMLKGSELFNIEYAPYSWIIPAILFILSIALLCKCFENQDSKKHSTVFKLFLLLVYTLSGLSVWLGMKQVDITAAYSGAIVLSFYGILFLLDAIWWKKILFQIPEQTDLKITMFLLILLGLFYPVIELLSGYMWPKMVLFGSECPTTTFVIGLLIGSLPDTNKWILGILSANAIIVGGYVGFNGFIVDALTYFPAGILGWVMLIRYWNSKRKTVYQSSCQVYSEAQNGNSAL